MFLDLGNIFACLLMSLSLCCCSRCVVVIVEVVHRCQVLFLSFRFVFCCCCYCTAWCKIKGTNALIGNSTKRNKQRRNEEAHSNDITHDVCMCVCNICFTVKL